MGYQTKYAPAREDGLKPWVVTRSEWGRQTDYIVWSGSARNAEWEVKGRQRYVSARARRATPEDVATLREYR